MHYCQPILVLQREMVILYEKYLLGRLLGHTIKEATEKICSFKFFVVICCCLIVQSITSNNYKLYELREVHGEVTQVFLLSICLFVF